MFGFLKRKKKEIKNIVDYRPYIKDHKNIYLRNKDIITFETKHNDDLIAFMIFINGRNRTFIHIIYDLLDQKCDIKSGLDDASYDGVGVILNSIIDDKLSIIWTIPRHFIIGDFEINLYSFLKDRTIMKNKYDISILQDNTIAQSQNELETQQLEKIRNSNVISGD